MNKVCRRCNEQKPIKDFGYLSASPDGRAYCCLACNRERDRNYRKAHPERVAESRARSRANARNRLAWEL